MAAALNVVAEDLSSVKVEQTRKASILIVDRGESNTWAVIVCMLQRVYNAAYIKACLRLDSMQEDIRNQYLDKVWFKLDDSSFGNDMKLITPHHDNRKI